MNIEKKDTIAATMRLFMESAPAVKDFPTYKSLNDAVGAIHDLAEGKCQALAGPKAWAWAKDQATNKWRPATEAEVEACRANAASKNHGTRASKVMTDEDRAALDSQVAALETVNNPALAPLLADLRGKLAADDLARKGTLRDRLAAAVETLGLDAAVTLLEGAIDAEAVDAEAV